MAATARPTISSSSPSGDGQANFLDDQESLILSLRLQLNTEMEKSVKIVNEAEDNAKKRLYHQKCLHDSKMKHHLSLLTQSAEEKKILIERCDVLAMDIKQLQTKYERKISEQEKRYHEAEKQTRSQLELAEKVRRQKWIANRTQEIKDHTLKRIEPEIQHILDLHKEESRQMHESFEKLLLQADKRAEEIYLAKLQDMEEAVIQRINEARQQERDLVFDIQNNETAKAAQAFRGELVKREEELKIVKDSYEERLRRQNEEIARNYRESEEKRQVSVRLERQQADDDRAAAEQQHKLETKALKDKLEKLFDEKQQEWKEEQESVFRRKLEETRAILHTERDQVLTTTTTAMSDELAQLQISLEKNTDRRMVRLQERYQREIAELTETLNKWKKSAEEANEQLRLFQSHENVSSGINHDLQKKLKDALLTIERLENAHLTISENVQNEYATRFSVMENRLQILTKELQSSRSHYDQDTEALKKQAEILKAENDSSLDTINAKVHDMLDRKDKKIEMLRQQILAFHQQRPQQRNRTQTDSVPNLRRASSATVHRNTSAKL